MTKRYLFIATASIILFAANSSGQDNQQENAEALKTANGKTPPQTQASEPNKTPEVKASNAEDNPPKDTTNKETADAREPTNEKATPDPIQGAETRTPTRGKDPDTEDKSTQENVKQTLADNINIILIIGFLGIVLTFFVCSTLILIRVKPLKQKNKEILRTLRQNQSKNPSGTEAITKPSEKDSQLKADLNDQLEQIAKYMQIVSKSSADAAASSQETLAFSKQLIETVVAKEQELGKLREGYQLSMLGPVINGFLNLRDDLNNILSTNLKGDLRKQLERLDHSLKISLSEVGVNELLLEIGSDPLALESKKWGAIEATRPTNEEQLDGAVAAIIKPGYTSICPQGSEIVIRKALVVRYKYNHQ